MEKSTQVFMPWPMCYAFVVRFNLERLTNALLIPFSHNITFANKTKLGLLYQVP